MTVRASSAKPAKKKKAVKRPAKKAAARSRTAKRAPRKEAKVATRLAKYRAMRDFASTPEPTGDEAAPGDGARSFVVQKHAASHLHYDFRLEHEGVLLSWSIPKGPSLRPGDRRLAVRTEDHPLSYADFEGIIPKGEYGGGTVIVWDRGYWLPDGDAGAGLAKGKLTFALHGEKLRGRFHLARTRLDAGRHENWLLFKGRDAAAKEDSDIVADRPESALTGRTIDEVAALPARVWHSNRTKGSRKPPREKSDVVAETKVVSKKNGRGARAGADVPDVITLVKQLPVRFALTNLDKPLYPDDGVRKAELIAYFAAAAPHLLPHAGNRPLTLVRCPHGAGHKCFFQKHANEGVPDVILRKAVKEARKTEEYMAVNDLPGMVALAQLGVLEIHTWVCHLDAVERPDQFVFDIDPDEALPWDQVVDAALAVRARLADIGLTSFVKTTGGKGLHVVAPIARRLDWEQHKNVARAVAESLEKEHPKRYLTNMRKSLRKGKIFLDYLRNGRGATAIAPYSTRARAGATVATPLTWDELTRGVVPRDFTIYSVTTRLSKQVRDPWADYARAEKQRIDARVLKRLVGD